MLHQMNRGHACIKFILFLFIMFGLIGCINRNQPTTGLYGKGTHTGTVTSLRVDNDLCRDSNPVGVDVDVEGVEGDAEGVEAQAPCVASNPEVCMPGPEARFVEARHKMDTKGLICSETVVTDTDDVTIALNSAFIKYFKETTGFGKPRKGEIALVMSFESGTANAESILIHATQGQTLGSFLNVEDWPMIGPLKVDGDSLKVRLVMIEIDRVENEQMRSWIRSLTSMATTLDPGLSSAARIAQPIIDAIIALNYDDVILDQRFSLQRVSPGKTPTRSPLLYGKYILVLQEDRLRNDDVNRIAQKATEPIVVSDMRFDKYSDRLYKTYNYYPYPGLPEITDTDIEPVDLVKNDFPKFEGIPTLAALMHEGLGPIDYSGFYALTKEESKFACAPFIYRDPLLKNWVNDDKIGGAMEIRENVLGYDNKGELGDLELRSCLDEVLKVVYCEATRGESQKRGSSKEGTVVTKASECKSVWRGGKKYSFEYPVTQYPKAYTVLAQYPLHTHLVFTVDRSLGGAGAPAHERLKKYSDFLEAEIAQASEKPTELFETFKNVHESNRKEKVLFKKLGAEEDKTKKACLLYDALPASATVTTIGLSEHINSVVIYNELYHVTGEVLTTRDEVKKHIETMEGCTSADAENKPSCCN